MLADGKEVLRFAVTVVDGADGPLALQASELDIYDVPGLLRASDAGLAGAMALRAGLTPAEIEESVAVVKAQLPQLHEVIWDHSLASAATTAPTAGPSTSPPSYPTTTSLRLHTPPRLSHKLGHIARHAAAKAYAALGLSGVAVVEGFVRMAPGWREELEGDPYRVPLLPDEDLGIRARMAEVLSETLAADPLPLQTYYDGVEW